MFKDYLTSIHVAAHCGNVKTAELLLKSKCNPDARALVSYTTLHVYTQNDTPTTRLTWGPGRGLTVNPTSS